MNRISFEYNGSRFYLKKDQSNFTIDVSFQLDEEFASSRAVPSISISSVIISNTDNQKIATQILEYISKGSSGGLGITQGPPIAVYLGTLKLFDGYVDLVQGFKKLSDSEIEVTIRPLHDLNSLEKRLSGITLGLLESQGVFSDSDFIEVPTVIEKHDNAIAIALLLYSTFDLIIQQANFVKEAIGITIDFAETIGIQVIGIGFSTSPIAAAIAKAIRLAKLIAYSVLVAIKASKMISELIDNVMAPIRYKKAIKLDRLLSKISLHLGYNFNSTISEFKGMVVMPRITREGSLSKNHQGSGLLTSRDYGYVAADLFKLCFDLFNSDLYVDTNSNTLHLESFANFSFWHNYSTHSSPSTLFETWPHYGNSGIGTNLSELSQYRIISTETDSKNIWSLRDSDRTVSEVHTTQVTTTDNRSVVISGVEDIKIPYALAVRKDSLSDLEKAVKAFLSIADIFLTAFGGNALGKLIDNRRGVVKLENHETTKPMLMYLESDNKLAANHRDKFNPVKCEQDYHFTKSFVRNNFGGQAKTIKGANMRLNESQFLEIINKPYFNLSDGTGTGKFDAVQWSNEEGIATVDLRFNETITTNLKETFFP